MLVGRLQHKQWFWVAVEELGTFDRLLGWVIVHALRNSEQSTAIL